MANRQMMATGATTSRNQAAANVPPAHQSDGWAWAGTFLRAGNGASKAMQMCIKVCIIR